MAIASRDRSRSILGAMSQGSERGYWYFLRVSGVLLVFLALGHIFITHYANVPSETTFDFVSARWANTLWRMFDWMLLLAALWHGLIGIRISITDYLPGPLWKQVAYALAWIVGLIFSVVGSITIITFNEEMSRNNSGPLSGDLWIADVLGALLYVIAVGTYLGIIALAIWVIRDFQAGRAPVYRGDPGQYAFVFHKAAGIGILFFLIIHIVDIMLIGLGRDVYDKSVNFYGQPFLVPMEILLVGALLYHSFNGLRIIAVDFTTSGSFRQRKMFWVVLIAAVVLTIPSAIMIIAKEIF
jgi:succinate dehydrogenase / fumarate reductase membrane anchor subunit